MWRRELDRRGLDDGLRHLGFKPSGGSWVRGGGNGPLRGALGEGSAGWLSISAPAATDSRAGDLGHPGLWKRRPDRMGLVFEVPLAALYSSVTDDDEPASQRQVVESVVDWALATLDGRPPEGWTAPELEALEAALPAQARSLRFGSFMASIAAVREPDRLRLSVTLGRISDGLSRARRRWLEVALGEAAALGLVRVGVSTAGPSAGQVEVEVDLTGAPGFLVAALAGTGAEALAAAYRRLVEPVNVIGSETFPSQALERAPGKT